MLVLEKIKNQIQNKPLMSLRNDLEKIFKKNQIDFTFSPFPSFIISTKEKRKIIITNKNNVEIDDSILFTENLAIGFLK